MTLEPGDTLAFDHTFAALRSYRTTKAKAIATGCNGRTKEIPFLYCVPSTKLCDASHGITQAIKKRKFLPAVITTDTIPHGIPFWKESFGETVHCRLGLYHFMARIADTLDPRSDLYWRCLVGLTDSIYKYNDADWQALIDALKNGKLGRDSRCFSDNEIAKLRYGKIFKRRYDKYLRKELHDEDSIIENLNKWVDCWMDEVNAKGRHV